MLLQIFKNKLKLFVIIFRKEILNDDDDKITNYSFQMTIKEDDYDDDLLVLFYAKKKIFACSTVTSVIENLPGLSLPSPVEKQQPIAEH